MGDGAIAGPSLLLAQHHKTHREHSRHIQQSHSHHPRHQEEKRALTIELPEDVIAEVIATIAVLQQVVVDKNGNIMNTPTILANPTGNHPLSPSLTSTPPLYSASTSSSSRYSSSSSPSISCTSSHSTLTGSSSLSATHTPSLSSTFSSLKITNTTSCISLSSTLSVQNFRNSSKTSTSLSKSSKSSHRSSTRTPSSSTSISSFYSSSSTNAAAPTNAIAGIPGAGITTANGTQPTGQEDISGGDDSSPTPTPVVVGGVVGSIAGAAIIIIAILFLLRWKKSGNQTLFGSRRGAEPIDDGPTNQPSGGMTERRSLSFAIPAALAGLVGKRNSQKTERTVSSTAGSERGFYRVSGRKLTSVLQTGGDGYGGGIPNENTMSGTTFYRDSQGFYSSQGGPSSPPISTSMKRDSGVPVIRPSPARTPTTEQSPFSDPSSAFTLSLRRPDLVGRSLHSQDGSHTSRFTEEV